MDDRWDSMRRWGNAVMRVGDISPKQMIRIQNRGIILIYATPRRIWHSLTRAGLKNGLKMMLAFALRVIMRIGKRSVPYES